MVSKHWRAEVKRRFRLLRTAVDKSQVDVELEADLPRGKYWRIENGIDEPTHDTRDDSTKNERERLARVLRVDSADIPLLSEPDAKRQSEARAS